MKSSTKTLAVAAIATLASTTAFAGGCVVAEDGTADEIGQGPLDVTALTMFTEKGNLGGTIAVATDPTLGANQFYQINWTDSAGAERYMTADVNNPLNLMEPVFKYGHVEVDPVTGIGSLTTDGEAQGSVTADGITIYASLLALGNPSKITVDAVSRANLGAGVLTTDGTEPASYTVGDSCDEKTNELAAVEITAEARANACEVVTDAANDMAPQLDITGASMFKQGSKIGATINVFDFTAPTLDGDYAVHWVDSTGKGYFIGVGVVTGNSLAYDGGADIGTYDPATGTYTWNADAEGEVMIEGNSLTVLVDEKYVGFPSGKLTGIGAMTTEYFTGFYPVPYDTTANDGEWTVGQSCGKSNDIDAANADVAANERANSLATTAAGGSLGWMTLLMAGLLGLRRRFK